MTLAMIVTVASIRETVRVWVESTLRSDLWVKAPAGRASGVVGDLPEDVVALPGEIAGRRRGRSVPRARRGGPAGRPFTIGSGDFRVLARLGGLPLARRPRPARRRPGGRASAARSLVSEPYARRFRRRRRREPSRSRRRRAQALLASPASTATTPTTGARSCSTASSTSRSSTTGASRASPSSRRRAWTPGDLRRRILTARHGRYALSITTNRELRREVLAHLRPDVRRHARASKRSRSPSRSSASPTRSSPRRSSGAAPSGCCAPSGPRAAQIRRAVLLEAGLTGARRPRPRRSSRGGRVRLPAARRHQPPILRLDGRPPPAGRRAAAAWPSFAASILAGIFPAASRRRRSGGRAGGRMMGLVIGRASSCAAEKSKSQSQSLAALLDRRALLLASRTDRSALFPARPRRARRRRDRVVVLHGASAGRGEEASTGSSSRSSACGSCTSRTSRGRTSPAKAFRYEEKAHLILPGIAGAEAGRLSVVQRGLVGREAGGAHQLHASGRDWELTLTLAPAEAPVIHGEGGDLPEGPGRGRVLALRVDPRLDASGTMRLGTASEKVAGTAWFDHEWGPGGLPEGSPAGTGSGSSSTAAAS